MNLWLLPRRTRAPNEVKEVERQHKWKSCRDVSLHFLFSSSYMLCLPHIVFSDFWPFLTIFLFCCDTFPLIYLLLYFSSILFFILFFKILLLYFVSFMSLMTFLLLPFFLPHHAFLAVAADPHYLLQWIYSFNIMDHYLTWQQLALQISILLQSGAAAVSMGAILDHYLPLYCNIELTQIISQKKKRSWLVEK